MTVLILNRFLKSIKKNHTSVFALLWFVTTALQYSLCKVNAEAFWWTPVVDVIEGVSVTVKGVILGGFFGFIFEVSR